MKIELPKPAHDGLKVDATIDDGVLAARFVGTADLETKPDLEVVVRQLQQEASQAKPSSVVIDFRELEFMNSSSFKIFVSWLGAVQELPTDEQYKITLRSNPNLHWQRRSLAALSCFAADLVAIET